jgi:hypothetical protein
LMPIRGDDGRLLFLLPPLAHSVTLVAAASCRLFGAILDGQLLDPMGPSYGAGFTPAAGSGRPGSREIKTRARLLLPRPRASPRSLELVVRMEGKARPCLPTYRPCSSTTS